MQFNPLIKYFILSVAVVVSPVLLFQNCSQFANPQDDRKQSSSSMSASSTPDANHVPQEILSPPTKQIRITNRRYMVGLFSNIFTAPDGTMAPQLEATIYQWMERRGAQLGGGCDLNDSLTLQDCNEDPSAGNLPAYGDPNAVRESFKIQMCEELLGSQDGLRIALGNMSYDITQLPEVNFESLKSAYELFYRTNEAPSYFLQTLSQLNVDLNSKGETPLNIWRGILLVVCESPEWELL